jgi:serine/threonine protein kinase
MHGKGIVHRDIKPENILLDQFGEAPVSAWTGDLVCSEPAQRSRDPPSPGNARLVDFGLATVFRHKGHSR